MGIREFFSVKKNNVSDKINVPLFIGSKEDFNKYLSGYGRNLVQKITKKHKKNIGRCEHCEIEDVTLDSAHIKGKERRDIIDHILNQFTSKGIVEINLNEFEIKFIQAHQPIEDTIKILCKKCHIKYDQTEVSLGNDFRTNRKQDLVISKENYVKYKRLTFNKNLIDSLDDEDHFTIHVTSTDEFFTFTKKQFKETFKNVVDSNSYKDGGVYSYTSTPRKTYQFLSNKPIKTEPILLNQKSNDQIKIGAYVRHNMSNILKNNYIDPEEIVNLQNEEYSKKVFNSNFRVLIKSSLNPNDNLGYRRYYTAEIIKGYFLCSQWAEHQRPNFDKWLRKRSE